MHELGLSLAYFGLTDHILRFGSVLTRQVILTGPEGSIFNVERMNLLLIEQQVLYLFITAGIKASRAKDVLLGIPHDFVQPQECICTRLLRRHKVFPVILALGPSEIL